MHPDRSRYVLTMSGAIAVLVLVASVTGLSLPAVYAQETPNWTLQAKGQDLGNLLAVPALLASAVAYAHGRARAGLVWLGALLYLIYAYVVYALATHFNGLFLVYVAVLGLSGYAVLFTAQDVLAANPDLPRGRPRTFAAWTLIVIGLLFALLWLGDVVPALLSGRPPAGLQTAGLVVNPIHVIDLSMVLPGFVLTGLAARRDRPFGLFWLAPWLAFSVLMGASIVASMILMTLAGESGTALPALLVSAVVLASAAALWRYLAVPARVTVRLS